MDKLPPAPSKFTLESTKIFYEQMNIAAPFDLQPVDQASILKILEKTDVNKAPGIDSLLAAPLTQLINLSISTASFPDPFKIAKLVSLYKKVVKLTQRIIDLFHYSHFFQKYLKELFTSKQRSFK